MAGAESGEEYMAVDWGWGLTGIEQGFELSFVSLV